MIKKFAYLLTVAAVTALVGCGGGGGSSGSSTSQNAVLEGVWTGTSSNGDSIRAIALEDGTTYMQYGQSSGGVFSSNGFDLASLGVSGNAISGAFNDYVYSSASSLPGTITGTVTTGSSFTGTMKYNSGISKTFSLTASDTSGYNYKTAASLSSIAGSWTAGTTTVSINSSTGAITGTAGSYACVVTGSVSPRPSGKNVFNVTMQFGSPCATVSFSGIAISYLRTSSSTTQLIMMLEESAKRYGTLFITTR